MHFQISTIFFMVPDDISKIFSIVLNIVRYKSGLKINSFTAPSDVTPMFNYIVVVNINNNLTDSSDESYLSIL